MGEWEKEKLVRQRDRSGWRHGQTDGGGGGAGRAPTDRERWGELEALDSPAILSEINLSSLSC